MNGSHSTVVEARRVKEWCASKIMSVGAATYSSAGNSSFVQAMRGQQSTILSSLTQKVQ
jgi:hypothetical protein